MYLLREIPYPCIENEREPLSRLQSMAKETYCSTGEKENQKVKTNERPIRTKIDYGMD